MTVLSWRDVDAPDFRGVADSYEVASRMFGQAMAAARGGLDDFKKTREQNNSNAVMAELLKYQDAESLQKDLASGAFQSRFNPNNVSAETMQALATRPKDLIALAADKTDLASDQADFGEKQKLIADRDHFRNNREVFNPYFDLVRQGRRQEATALAEANAPVFEQANTAMMQELINSGENIYGDGIRNDQNKVDLGQDVKLFDQGQEDRQVDLLFDQVKASVNRSGLPEDHLRHLNTNYDTYVDRYGARAVNRLLNSLTNDFRGGTGSGTGGGVSGTAAPVNIGEAQKSVASVLSQGGLPAPVVAGFLGNFEVEGGYEGGQGDGGSASGIAQWRKERREAFVQRNGKQPHQATPAEQAQHVLWELTTPEGRRVAGISEDQANAILNAKDAGTAAALIDEYYERSDGTHRQRRIDAALGFVSNPQDLLTAGRTVIEENISGSPQSNLIRNLHEAWQDKREAGVVAAELTKEGGVFAGQDTDNLTRLIKKIADDNGLSPAVAASILREAHTGRQGVLGRMFTNFWGNDGLTIDYNTDQIKELVNLAKDRKALAEQAVSLDRQVKAPVQLEQANAAVDALTNEIRTKALRAAQMGVPYDPSIDMQRLGDLKGQQAQAARFLAEAATAGSPTPPDHTPTNNRRGAGPGAPASAEVHPVLRQAQAITRLNGVIGQRQAARFKQTYGMSPEEAIANPDALPKIGRSVTTRLPGGIPTRDELRSAATRAIAGGAATIRAFQQLYGHHPRHFK